MDGFEDSCTLVTPSERLLAELSRETIVDPITFVNNNPVQVN